VGNLKKKKLRKAKSTSVGVVKWFWSKRVKRTALTKKGKKMEVIGDNFKLPEKELGRGFNLEKIVKVCANVLIEGKKKTRNFRQGTWKNLPRSNDWSDPVGSRRQGERMVFLKKIATKGVV